MTKVPFSNPKPIRLTRPQVEALWLLRQADNELSAFSIKTTSALRRMRLARWTLGFWQITVDGLAELALWEQTHPRTRLGTRKPRSWRQAVLALDPKATLQGPIRAGHYVNYQVVDGAGKAIGWTEGNDQGTRGAWMMALGTLTRRMQKGKPDADPS